jgi:hypothetical protein
MATAYEWTIEEYDGEDIIDSIVFDSYEEARHFLSEQQKLVLRKLRSNKEEDSVDTMAYAYLTLTGELPQTFDDGSKVPVRFRKELLK